MPKVKSIESQTAIPSNPFAGGAPAQITINLPQDLGKVTDLVAQFTMTFSTTDASGADIAVVPSPFFLDYYQVIYETFQMNFGLCLLRLKAGLDCSHPLENFYPEDWG
jgi:hypothetical protein